MLCRNSSDSRVTVADQRIVDGKTMMGPKNDACEKTAERCRQGSSLQLAEGVSQRPFAHKLGVPQSRTPSFKDFFNA